MVACQSCSTRRAVLRRPRDKTALCRECFFEMFEQEVHDTVLRHSLFRPNERVVVGVSGGKDSTVLAHVLCLLNARHGYRLDIQLVAVDEGIRGYRDESLRAVQAAHGELPATAECPRPPLLIISYTDLYGWTMDDIVAATGKRSSCTFCGVFRRQALDRAAQQLNATQIVTGHNAEDYAETILMNLFRGDAQRLARSSETLESAPTFETGPAHVRRTKPMMYSYQKEIVLYAYFRRLRYFSTECTYAPESFRGGVRQFLIDSVTENGAGIVLDIIRSGQSIAAAAAGATNASKASATSSNAGASTSATSGTCTRCGFMSSQRVCKACVLLEGLNRGLPKLGIGKTEVLRRRHGLQEIQDDSGGGR